MSSIKHLLSLPPQLVDSFKDIYEEDSSHFFCGSDPVGNRVGSGGGTSCLLSQCWQDEKENESFADWLAKEKRILIHAGGQSRRLPSYAPVGKILTPIPVFRWERGQKLNQTLLDLQSPLYQKIITAAPPKVNTLIASGDVLILNNKPLEDIPDADVICYALWANPDLASRHGVFVCDKYQPQQLLKMLQKPNENQLRDIASKHLYLMDIGIWLLSDKAVDLLMNKSGYQHGEHPSTPGFYDLYSQFGLALGSNPTVEDEELSKLTVAIIPLDEGEFYHYGTSKELISSTLAIQNRINDQRSILHKDTKPHPSMFIQNAVSKVKLEEHMQNLWIENSHIGAKWKLNNNHIITGVPENDWDIELPSGACIDITPISETQSCIRPYQITDTFSGQAAAEGTQFLGIPLINWLSQRGITLEEAGIAANTDIQEAALFPIFQQKEIDSEFISWLIEGNNNPDIKKRWLECKRLSASEISDQAKLPLAKKQRQHFRNLNWPSLRRNAEHSVFYQINLDHAAQEFATHNIPVDPVSENEMNPQVKLSEKMFQTRINQYKGIDYSKTEGEAFDLLRNSIRSSVNLKRPFPQLNIFPDQIVWGRSPVRIDLAGGWTDTPPYCMFEGGKVVNLAINLNGQPPLQTYIKPSREFKIIIRSIDLGTREIISSWDELANYNRIGSAFSIPKAALCLAGFLPEFSPQSFASLEQQLKHFGCGIEITMLAAIPKGSGLGTSSALAATVLGTLSDFCGLNWDHSQICMNTLILEQLLTSGGGWQDQFGAILPGVKLLETSAGFNQQPAIKWAPDYLFSDYQHKSCMLLYYTGITRTAKNILSEIVRKMFLNTTEHLDILMEMKQHATHTFETLQKNNFEQFAACVSKTWDQKKRIDKGTNPPEIEALIKQFEDLALAYKLPGAGGGGYMYIIAKDPEAAVLIKKRLNENPPNENARFVSMELSQTGFQVTRS